MQKKDLPNFPSLLIPIGELLGCAKVPAEQEKLLLRAQEAFRTMIGELYPAFRICTSSASKYVVGNLTDLVPKPPYKKS